MRMQVAAAVLVMAGAGRGQAAVPATEPGERWAGVIRALSSETFAEREAAQKSLEAATLRDVGVLRALAKTAADAEVKTRLEKRLDALELQVLVGPPPVSLAVKEADISELAAGLSAATGVEWTAWISGAPRAHAWTINAVDRPLWEVFVDLEKQAAVHVQNSEGRVLLQAGPMMPGGIGPIDGGWTDVAAGDFLFYVGIGHGGPVGLHPAGQVVGPTVKLEYGMRGDPRMRLVRCAIPDILSVVDENGKVLHSAEPRPRPNWIGGGLAMPEVNTALGFPEAEGMGKKLTITGQMTVRRATAVEKLGIAELTTQASEPVAAGGRTWQMWAIDPLRDEGWVINVTEQRPGAGVPLTFVPMAVKVIDAAGKVVWQGAVDRQVSVRVKPGAVKKPLHAEIIAVKESADDVVKFEIKDVPVPEKVWP